MKRHLPKILMGSLVLLLFVSLLASGQQQRQQRRRMPRAPWEERSPALGKVIPDFDVFDENLNPIKLSNLYKGSLLYFQWGGCT